MGSPNSWMVYFMENPHLDWMMTGATPIFRTPPCHSEMLIRSSQRCAPHLSCWHHPAKRGVAGTKGTGFRTLSSLALAFYWLLLETCFLVNIALFQKTHDVKQEFKNELNKCWKKSTGWFDSLIFLAKLTIAWKLSISLLGHGRLPSRLVMFSGGNRSIGVIVIQMIFMQWSIYFLIIYNVVIIFLSS